MTNAEARFNNSLRPRKPEGSLGRTAQDVHLDSHTAPELCNSGDSVGTGIYSPSSPTSIPPPPPPPPFFPSLISLMVSVDVKHHVYLLTGSVPFPPVSLQRQVVCCCGRFSCVHFRGEPVSSYFSMACYSVVSY